MMYTDSLVKALNIEPRKYPVIAVVGGGGKTSLIFRLARELCASGKKVIVTTTTHMAYDPTHPFAEDGDADKIRQNLAKYHYTVTASLDRNKGKIGSIQETETAQLRRMADILLIEADGAKRLPLKVPGEWEPVIPEFTDLVVGVIGMDALGQPISTICHRPERVSEFLKKEQSERVTEEDMFQIARSETALKKAVAGRSYRVFLNKTDIPGAQNAAENIGRRLQTKDTETAWGSLQKGEFYR